MLSVVYCLLPSLKPLMNKIYAVLNEIGQYLWNSVWNFLTRKLSVCDFFCSSLDKSVRDVTVLWEGGRGLLLTCSNNLLALSCHDNPLSLRRPRTRYRLSTRSNCSHYHSLTTCRNVFNERSVKVLTSIDRIEMSLVIRREGDKGFQKNLHSNGQQYDYDLQLLGQR